MYLTFPFLYAVKNQVYLAISNLKLLSYLQLSFFRSLHYFNKYIAASLL